MEEEEWKREKTDRENRHVIVSQGKQQGLLHSASLSALRPWETLGCVRCLEHLG